MTQPASLRFLNQYFLLCTAATEELVNLSNLSIKLFSTNTFSAIPCNRIRPCRRLPLHVICIAVVVITITKCVSSILLYVRWQSALRLLLFMPSLALCHGLGCCLFPRLCTGTFNGHLKVHVFSEL